MIERGRKARGYAIDANSFTLSMTAATAAMNSTSTIRGWMREPLIVHPFLFGIYPLLALYGYNFEDVLLKHVVLSILWSVALTGIVFAILGSLVKDRIKAGLLASGSVLLFFFYGRVRMYLF